jgi:multidrug transporter EmrE-like cation transporter
MAVADNVREPVRLCLPPTCPLISGPSLTRGEGRWIVNIRMAASFLITVALSLAGQSLLRVGAKTVMDGAPGGVREFFSRIPQFALSPHIIGGVALCGLGAMSWVYILSQYEISRALPILGGLAYIALFFSSRVFLGEQTNWVNFAGILLIIGGLYMVSLKAA